MKKNSARLVYGLVLLLVGCVATELIVVTQRDEVWEYDNVQSLVDEATRDYKRVSLRI